MFGLVTCPHGQASQFGYCQHKALTSCPICGKISRESYIGVLCEQCGEVMEEECTSGPTG